MGRFGIHTEGEYLSMGKDRRLSGARVAYNLLNIGEHPTEEQIRLFEDISFTLRTSNGTYRTSYRNRFQDVDAAAMRHIAEVHQRETGIRVQDRAVSHGLSSEEWADRLLAAFPEVQFEASDLLLYLVELSLDSGETYIAEESGVALQYIKAPFVTSLHHAESWRNPVLRSVAARAQRRFKALNLPEDWTHTDGGPGYKVRRISCIHPEAQMLACRTPRFRFCARSVFDHTPGACHVLRTVNILNRDYFSSAQLLEGAAAVFNSLVPGGLWIMGRTLVEDFTNHVTFFRKGADRWELLERVGNGSDLEELVMSARYA